MTRRQRRWLSAVVLLATLPVLCVRIYREVIPTGADFFPFWFASVEGPMLRSPDGRRAVQVVFNDAGGAHSGNHWTWLITKDWLTGKRVVAEGYSLSNVRFQKVDFPLNWSDDRTFSVDFVARRYRDSDGPIAGQHMVVQIP